MKISITGETKLERNELRKLIASKGHLYEPVVVADTDLLVVGEFPGSRFTAAIQLGVKTISEKQFMEAI